MAFGGFNESNHQAPMAEINVTPMVDVMLVLLVIFIITAPLLQHTVKVNLPAVPNGPSSTISEKKTGNVTITVNSSNEIYWNNSVVSLDELRTRFATASQQTPKPEVQLRVEKSARYELFVQVLAAAMDHGITKFQFDTEFNDAAK